MEILGNQEESKRGRGLNPEDQEITSTIENQGIRRKIARLERKMNKVNKKGIRRKMW